MQDKSWEFTSANLVALLSAVLIMFAFIFLPWYGSALTENGARILSDNLYGAVSAKPAPLIWLVPIVSLGGILFGLLGIFSVDRSRIAALISLGLGLVGLGYFLYMLANPLLKQTSSSPGIGFWLSLAGVVILASIDRVGFAPGQECDPKPSKARRKVAHSHLTEGCALSLLVVPID